MSDFFNRIEMPTKLSDYQIDPQEAAERVQARFLSRGTMLGEHHDITSDAVASILRMSE